MLGTHVFVNVGVAAADQEVADAHAAMTLGPALARRGGRPAAQLLQPARLCRGLRPPLRRSVRPGRVHHPALGGIRPGLGGKPDRLRQPRRGAGDRRAHRQQGSQQPRHRTDPARRAGAPVRRHGRGVRAPERSRRPPAVGVPARRGEPEPDLVRSPPTHSIGKR